MATAPARWLVEHAHLLPSRGDAVDVACGRGRNALWLAAHGLTTVAIDRDEQALAMLHAEATARGLPVLPRCLDLETGRPVLPAEAFDAVVVVHYLHRPLFAQLKGTLRPGGVLVYETFTTHQAARGRPTNPDYLLEPGELRQLVQPLEIVVEREGDFDGRMVASVIARRPV